MLQKEFEEFNCSIKIENEATILREKRDMLKADFKNKFPEICGDKGIEVNKCDIEFISQGSYKLQTTIHSKSGNVDLDQGVIVPIDIYEHDDPRELKKIVRESLEIKNTRIPKIKEPCVTIKYIKQGENWIHLDFPFYAKKNNELYLARGKEFSSHYGLKSIFETGFKRHSEPRLPST
ncbi:cyclic GMP-AMP synthase DncV-like nucleotidyltransferase, partial [Liquorilactobacillus satsumensis]